MLSPAMDSPRRLTGVEGRISHSSNVPNCGDLHRLWVSSIGQEIGFRCFYRAKSLVSISFEYDSQSSRIEEEAFQRSGLRSIYFPASVLEIRESSIANCESLTSIIFDRDSRLQRIEVCAFDSIPIATLTIPGGVEYFSGSAFEGEKLKFVSFSPFSTKFIVDGGTIRDISGHQLIRIFGKWRSFRVLNSVKIICEY
jgi:hypothetical protein